jgi:hypothetical protein
MDRVPRFTQYSNWSWSSGDDRVTSSCALHPEYADVSASLQRAIFRAIHSTTTFYICIAHLGTLRSLASCFKNELACKKHLILDTMSYLTLLHLLQSKGPWRIIGNLNKLHTAKSSNSQGCQHSQVWQLDILELLIDSTDTNTRNVGETNILSNQTDN